VGEGEGGGLVSWNQCAWANLNLGLNYGHLVECRINKQQDDTWLRVTWNGNMRVTNCDICCMRWFFTINGEECTEPGPVDAVIFMEADLHILRQSHISGICRGAGGQNISSGTVLVQFLVNDCPGFQGFVYDAYTGWNSISRIILEEIIPRDDTFTELIAVEPPAHFTFFPHYCQYFFPTLGGRAERNVGTVIQVRFKKDHLFTALKFTWEGNFRQKSCTNCCAQWWFSVDGSRCTSFEDITTAIFSLSAVDMFAPTTLTGVCNQVGGVAIIQGPHNIKLEVGNCPGSGISNTASGFFSTSRIIVEEVPLATNPDVRNDTYHPNWEHCAIPAPIPEGTRDIGPLNTLSCGSNLIKTHPDSALRVTFNGNIRLTDCSDCCMRWFFTINGEECAQPAPIDAVIYTVNGSQVNIHRGSTITGICTEIESGVIPVGSSVVTLNLGVCGGFNETFDSYTGLQSLSVIEVEEMPLSVPQTEGNAGFIPNWIQCTESNLSSSVVNASVMNCSFTKRDNDSVVKVAWDGNIAVEGCTDCCMRWYITIDGAECGDPGPIDAAIRADLEESGTPQFDLRRPATISGICRGQSTEAIFSAGTHTFGLVASPCVDLPRDSQVLTGTCVC
jgi:hypothetical protein